jgi:uncharacterized protein (TIRG00374 family)
MSMLDGMMNNIKLGISLIFLYVLFTKFLSISSFAMVKDIGFEIIILCLFFALLSIIIRSLRWILVLDMMGYHIRFLESLRLSLIGIYYGSISPGRMGEFVRGYRLSKKGIPARDGLISVLYDRLYDIVTPLSLAGTYYISTLFDLPLILWLLLANLLIIPFWGLFIHLFQRFKTRFHYLKEVRYVEVRISLRRQVLQAFLSIANWVCYGITGYFLFIGLGVSIDFGYVLSSISIVTLMVLVPITISGWGVREGAYVLFFSFYSKPETSIMFSIIFVLINTYLLAIMGLVVELMTGDGRGP